MDPGQTVRQDNLRRTRVDCETDQKPIVTPHCQISMSILIGIDQHDSPRLTEREVATDGFTRKDIEPTDHAASMTKATLAAARPTTPRRLRRYQRYAVRCFVLVSGSTIWRIAGERFKGSPAASWQPSSR